ncbi:MAG: thermonuclease family protein [Sedimentisphaerales bacterium]|jgi:endonuclease YncB( thermonuclease family)
MSRRRRTGILLLCFLGFALLVLLDHGAGPQRPFSQRLSEAQATAYDVEKYHGKTFAVVHVIDGDTLDIDVSDGKYKHTRIRLLGIDAPEANVERSAPMFFAPQATEYVRRLSVGKPVTVYLDAPNPTRGHYGRLLAYVQLPDGRFLNEVLLAEGYAYADRRFQHSFYNKYRQLESRARSGKKGLWQNVTRDQLPEWLQRMEPKLLNK